MIFGFEVRFAYAFIAGVLATVNPCGFVLLPTYLAFFLGMEGTRPGTQRAELRRALLVSAAVSSGFLAVFLIIGLITRLFTGWIQQEASDYLSIIMGALLVVVGIATLFGKHLPLMTPKLDAGGRDTTVRSMFLYGISYALASIGCTLPLFTSTILSQVSKTGFVSGVVAIAVYGVGMGLVLSALTVSLALARSGMLRVLRRVMTRIDLVSGIVLVLAGIYLVWYGYTALSDRSSAVTDSAFDLQGNVATWLNNLGAGWLFAITGGITAAAIAVVVSRRRRPSPTEG